MMEHIVTRDSLEDLIHREDEVGMHAIGRALVALFRRQTEDEQATNTTRMTNFRGFTQADARSGSITAKYYMKHGKLEDWQRHRWLKPNRRGTSRLAKYWRQLDEEARRKAERRS